MNKHRIQIMPSGYGHYEITTPVYGKPFTFVTSNTSAIDDYRSAEGERNPLTRELRTLRGYRDLRAEAMNRYRVSKKYRS